MNKDVRQKILIFLFWSMTYGLGYFMGQHPLKEELKESLAKQERLQEENNRLNDYEEMMLNSFSLDTLIVADFYQMSEVKSTYVLQSFETYYNEIHGFFKAYPIAFELERTYPEEYYSFYEGTPLIEFMTEEEKNRVQKNNGQITLQEIDDILKRITNKRESNEQNLIYARKL